MQNPDVFSNFFNLNTSNVFKEEKDEKQNVRFKPGQDRYGRGFPEGFYETPKTRDQKKRSSVPSIEKIIVMPDGSIKKVSQTQGQPSMTSLDNWCFMSPDADGFSGSKNSITKGYKKPFGRQPFSHHF